MLVGPSIGQGHVLFCDVCARMVGCECVCVLESHFSSLLA